MQSTTTLFSRLLGCIMLFAAMSLNAEDTWYPSKFGADDTLGAINNLSAEKVLQAAQLVMTHWVPSTT